MSPRNNLKDPTHAYETKLKNETKIERIKFLFGSSIFTILTTTAGVLISNYLPQIKDIINLIGERIDIPFPH